MFRGVGLGFGIVNGRRFSGFDEIMAAFVTKFTARWMGGATVWAGDF
jgi:hypothetical protein